MSALFFPYIAAPIVVGLMMGKVSQREATRFTLILALLSCTIIIPLNALWWWLIGALG
jgi:4-hydroxybenzoate polyprenyltransferase